MTRRRDGDAHLLGVRPVHDHVTGYLTAVERDVHALAGHQPEVGQRFEAWAHQLGGPVLATAHGAVVEPHRVTDVGTVSGRLDRGYDAGAQLAVVAARRAHARTDNRPLGQPLAGTRGRARVPLSHPDRRGRSVQLDGGRHRRSRRTETPNVRLPSRIRVTTTLCLSLTRTRGGGRPFKRRPRSGRRTGMRQNDGDNNEDDDDARRNAFP